MATRTGARDLDVKIIEFAANDEIKLHTGPELNFLVLVLEGSGDLQTEIDKIIPLWSGSLV